MAKRPDARHFYLNEQHELSRVQREGGGRPLKLGTIDWHGKERRLSRSLTRTRRAIADSADPLRQRRFYLLARPESSVPKVTENLRKAPTGHYEEVVDYGGKDSKVLGRLGLDVLAVTTRGAVVHVTPERFDRLEAIAPNLAGLGTVERSRWAFVSDFDVVPAELRADKEWLVTLGDDATQDAVVELQPLLSRTDGSLVLSSIAEGLRRAHGEAILASGTDFSGRSWVRAALAGRTIKKIVKDFFSVQAVHAPLLSPVFAVSGRPSTGARRSQPAPVFTADTPVVAVVDTGVAKNHILLGPYRRGLFVHPQAQDGFDSHGTYVSSRVVFGDPPDPLNTAPAGECRFVDVVVAETPKKINEKIVTNAIEIVSANYPDARVFNLSFGHFTPVDQGPPVEGAQRLFLTQDLDNLIFARDLLVVVAAGNSEEGAIPSADYPQHWQDPSWRVGYWAAGFNTLKCGSFVREWTLAGGTADVPYAPSPFSRFGPGLANAPVPDFSAHGGNAAINYRYSPGLGVWALSPGGLWEDLPGTSYSAPILARECAFALRALQSVCPSGSHPFASTVKVLFALTAQRTDLPPRFREAAARGLGYGEASRNGVNIADPESALFVWQGVLSHKSDTARVVVAIPRTWLEQAGDPVCDVALAWDTPVNAAVPNVYGCRRVGLKLKPNADSEAARGSRGAHASYPLRVRTYGLRAALENALDKGLVIDDSWIVELAYEELCDYPPTQVFTPEQRVSFALRLRDKTGQSSPQLAVQAAATAGTMTRLSAAPIPVQVPVSVKNVL